jgi:hypothetical protein
VVILKQQTISKVYIIGAGIITPAEIESIKEKHGEDILVLTEEEAREQGFDLQTTERLFMYRLKPSLPQFDIRLIQDAETKQDKFQNKYRKNYVNHSKFRK